MMQLVTDSNDTAFLSSFSRCFHEIAGHLCSLIVSMPCDFVVWQEELHGKRHCLFTWLNKNCCWSNGWYRLCLQNWRWLVGKLIGCHLVLSNTSEIGFGCINEVTNSDKSIVVQIWWRCRLAVYLPTNAQHKIGSDQLNRASDSVWQDITFMLMVVQACSHAGL